MNLQLSEAHRSECCRDAQSLLVDLVKEELGIGALSVVGPAMKDNLSA